MVRVPLLRRVGALIPVALTFGLVACSSSSSGEPGTGGDGGSGGDRGASGLEQSLNVLGVDTTPTDRV